MSTGTYRPAKPVGERCYHSALVPQGRERNEWDASIRLFKQEMDALWSNSLDPELSKAQHIDYVSSLKTLLLRCESGTLRVGPGRMTEADVIRDIILELKPKLSSEGREAFGKKPRKLRLYFGEPALHPRKLLMLHLDTKESGDGWKEEQNSSIAEAIRRADHWALAGEELLSPATDRVLEPASTDQEGPAE